MKKLIMLSIIITPFILNAESKSLDVLKANSDISVTVNRDIALADINIKMKLDKGSEYVNLVFDRIIDKIRDLDSRAVMIKDDIGGLISRASDIAMTGNYNSLFLMESRNTMDKLLQYYDDVVSLDNELVDLLKIVGRDKDLYKITNDINKDVKFLIKRWQFDIGKQLIELTYTVSLIDSRIIDYEAIWTTYEISRISRDITYILVRDVYDRSFQLIQKTKPLI
ncbi:MAG: hypothetical protein ACP5IO_05405 [Elusimicrobiales bacterium]